MEKSQNDKNETTLESKSIERSSIRAILKSFMQQTQHRYQYYIGWSEEAIQLLNGQSLLVTSF